MNRTLSFTIFTLILTVTWIDRSVAQQPATGQMLRVFTTSVVPDKRDQLPEIVNAMTKVVAAAKGISWFTIGSDSTTGEIRAAMLWDSQADLEAFVKDDARIALTEKLKPLIQGEPTTRHY